MEVRFEGVQVETEVFRETSRNLPSLYNTLRNSVEVRMLVLGRWRPSVWLHTTCCIVSGCSMRPYGL